MGLLSGPKNTVQKWNSIRTNSSTLGITIPILFGQQRLAGRLIWYGDFVAKHAKQQGGKGLLKGGVQYVYTASVIALLAHGPLNYLLNVWNSNGRFQLFSASESYTITSGAGLNYTALNASIYGNDQGVALPSAYSVGPFTNFGSPGPVTLTGTQNVPFTQVSSSPGTGQYSVNQATGVYTFAAADVGKAIVVNYSYYRYRLVTEELTVVPFTPGPYTVTVDNSTNFIADDGVNYYPAGTAFVKVGGLPSVGQYSQSGGTYTFNSADQGQGIVINYEYTDPNTDTNAPNQLNLTLVGGALGQAPLSYMTGKHPSQALGYSLDSYIFSSGLYLGYSPELPNYSYEAAGAFQVGGGIVDCNPADCITSILTDPHFGVGFPFSFLQPSFYQKQVPQSLLASDTFTRANENPLTAPWTIVEGTIQLLSDAVSPGTTSDFAYAIYSGPSWPADQYSEITVKQLVAGAGYVAAVLRSDGTANNFYFVDLDAAVGFGGIGLPTPLNLQKVVGGVLQGPPFHGFGTVTPHVGDVFRAQIIGSTITVFQNGIQVGASFTDPTPFATGSPGFVVQTASGISAVTDVAIDGWSGGAAGVNIFDGSARTCWLANSFVISPFLDNSASCASQLSKWLEAGMVGGFWSEGLLKFVPYGDSTAVGNGVTYFPPTGPIASITDDQYLVDKAEDPVKIERTAWQDVYNRVRVSYSARVNDYNPEVIYEQDDASITRFGLRIKDPLQYDFITTLPAAQYAASMAVQRNCYIRNTYTFRLPDIFSYLEPMDIIQLTDINLGLEATPVRITKIEDDPKKGLAVTAETFLWGPAAPAFNPKLTNGPTGGGDPNADPGDTNVVIFEAPDRLGKFGGDVLYIFCSGVNVNWGGCHVWVSFDGTNYSLYTPPGINAVTQAARVGTLTSPTGTLLDALQTSGALSGSWTALRGSFQGTAISPNLNGTFVHTVASSPTDAVAYYNASSPTSGNFWAQVQVSHAIGSGGLICPAVRIQTGGGDTYYSATYGSPLIQLTKCVAGVVTNLGAPTTYTIHTGDLIRIEAAGSTITLSINATLVLSVNDTSITGGTWGIRGTALTNQNIYNFVAGNSSLEAYSSANPDTGDTALIQLVQNSQALSSVSSTDAAQGVSLCALVNPVTNTIELFSYQTATLQGSGLFALTTLYRGLFGTAGIAHVAGETFARLDQASLVYQYDPSFIGQTIFFKFTSFNLYGQMEEALANVEAISFPLAGVGLGMYSLVNGMINSTFYMQQVQAVATILSGMGLTQSGTSTTILMASGSVQYGSGTVSYSSASVNPGSLGTWYCYFNDPTYSGGSITLLATQTVPTLVSAPGYFYVGAITTSGGGGGTGGGGGGGTGGGGCFSGNVKIKTALDGLVAFEDLPSPVVIQNKMGTQVAHVLVHDHDGPMIDIGNGLLVTENHNMVTPEGDCMRAREYFAGCKTVHYKGKVYNLSVHTSEEAERHYILETGDIAHNTKFYK